MIVVRMCKNKIFYPLHPKLGQHCEQRSLRILGPRIDEHIALVSDRKQRGIALPHIEKIYPALPRLGLRDKRIVSR